MKKNRIVSGIQPSNQITLGNYLGAINMWKEMSNDYEMFLFVADMHSITAPFDKDTLLTNRKNIIALYYACGLDLEKNNVFYQSDVIHHNTLGYILTCHTTLGELNRMTQFKDKSVKNKNNTTFIPSGLLYYPALMAADILIYDANYVIVGSDQKQHVELTRDIAIRLNNKYNENLFVVPEPFIGKENARIMDLQNPLIKMSKSNNNEKGTIFMLDDIETITSKIMKAKTDTLNKVKYDFENQPGITNLINIYSSLTKESVETITQKFSNIDNYGTFKKEVIKELVNVILPIQQKYKETINNFDPIQMIVKLNAKKCIELANSKIDKVYKAIGMK